MSAAPTLPRAQIPVEHLQILLQRFESLLSSIVGLKEEISVVPGMDEWPALLHRYTNLLSHAYSLSSSLLSASPHFLPSQLASFNKVLEAEATNANLYADAAESSTLFGGILAGRSSGVADDGVKATADGLPELSFYDRNNPLPLLLAHPVLPISEEHINFLGALLRTAPEADILKEESRLVESYDASTAADFQGDVNAELEDIQDEISRHDTLALRALRIWYHLRNAPDEEGNVLNVRERIAAVDQGEDDAGKEEEGNDSDGDSDDDSEDGAEARAAHLEERQRRRMEQNCWTADAVSAFLRGHTTSL
ncbi:hypothetical protein PHSY_006688 [Pseudozyma hubeiensis SY62]|uniref:Uncharacterized protein n=1 Tax=Pseudozyma hubeiensis (strain SY62) TaxID=1305764 RepID=R9PCJ4_PSEHS|nr:hypothetical protein PHSY_006688 [Pseudozyma hubeiensis SY62]GAC99091.1 hypothetical protein PHSY_006688 [Pseudozyma hubeiensis SY62]